MSYSIVRFYQDGRGSDVIEEGLTLEEAQEHCNDPETSSRTASEETLEALGIDCAWFDGYREE